MCRSDWFPLLFHLQLGLPSLARSPEVHLLSGDLRHGSSCSRVGCWLLGGATFSIFSRGEMSILLLEKRGLLIICVF